jgi:hypothetical protein
VNGEGEIRVTEVRDVTDYAGHEFEYQSGDDVFRCSVCGEYEVSLRVGPGPQYRACPGPEATVG